MIVKKEKIIQKQPSSCLSLQDVLVSLFHWCCHLRPKSTVILLSTKRLGDSDWMVTLNTISEKSFSLSEMRSSKKERKKKKNRNFILKNETYRSLLHHAPLKEGFLQSSSQISPYLILSADLNSSVSYIFEQEGGLDIESIVSGCEVHLGTEIKFCFADLHSNESEVITKSFQELFLSGILSGCFFRTLVNEIEVFPTPTPLSSQSSVLGL